MRYSKKCESCLKSCKQPHYAIVVKCDKYIQDKSKIVKTSKTKLEELEAKLNTILKSGVV